VVGSCVHARSHALPNRSPSDDGSESHGTARLAPVSWNRGQASMRFAAWLSSRSAIVCVADCAVNPFCGGSNKRKHPCGSGFALSLLPHHPFHAETRPDICVFPYKQDYRQSGPRDLLPRRATFRVPGIPGSTPFFARSSRQRSFHRPWMREACVRSPNSKRACFKRNVPSRHGNGVATRTGDSRVTRRKRSTTNWKARIPRAAPAC
jgi:hypothetical protein